MKRQTTATPVVARRFQGRRMDDSRREAMLDSLLALVLEQGFAALTMDAFAAQARCSKTTLYALGADKERLVATLYRRFFRQATDAITARIAPIATERQRIAEYLAAIGDEMSRMSPECYTDMTQHEATSAIYGLNSRAAANRVKDFIEDGIATGEFRAANARFVGESVGLLIDAIMHGTLLRRTGLSSGRAYNEIATLVLNALTNPART